MFIHNNCFTVICNNCWHNAVIVHMKFILDPSSLNRCPCSGTKPLFYFSEYQVWIYNIRASSIQNIQLQNVTTVSEVISQLMLT